VAALAVLLAASSAPAAEEAPPPAHALILFGANWCAPCLAELRSLPDYGAMIAPAPLLVAWTDGQPPRLWPAWPGNAQMVPLGQAPALLARIGGKTAGLPYVAMLDEKGRLCADLRGKLDRERLAAMLRTCRGGATR